MIDLLSDHELKELSGTDSSLARAFKEYADDPDEDEGHDYEE